jgi:hypothetical protein
VAGRSTEWDFLLRIVSWHKRRSRHMELWYMPVIRLGAPAYTATRHRWPLEPLNAGHRMWHKPDDLCLWRAYSALVQPSSLSYFACVGSRVRLAPRLLTLTSGMISKTIVLTFVLFEVTVTQTILLVQLIPCSRNTADSGREQHNVAIVSRSSHLCFHFPT